MTTKQQPKLLVFAPSAYPLGGVQTWLSYLLPGLSKAGIETILVLSSGKFHDPKKYLKFHPELNDIDVEILCAADATQVSRIEAIKKVIVERQADACVVVNLVDVFQAVTELRDEKLSSTKLISTLHGVHAGMLSMIKHYKDSLDAVVSTNRLTQTLVQEKCGIDKERALYAPYGVNTKIEYASEPNPQRFRVAYVGRFEEEQKRISDLLTILSKAFNQIDNMDVLLAGDGHGTQLEEWLNIHKDKESQIRFHGVLTPAELSRHVYQEADVLLLTSSWETGPIVAWEAMAHGVTLISSRYIGSRHEGSLTHDQNCLMFDVGDCDSAVSQLKRAMDRNLRQKLNANAADLVEQRYTISKSVAAWHSAIAKVIANKTLPYKDIDNIGRDQGQLNTLFSTLPRKTADKLARAIRKAIGKKVVASNAGAEWPHSYHDGDESLVDLSAL